MVKSTLEYKDEKYPYPDHIVERAKDILTNGKPLEFSKEIFHREHYGDDHLCAFLAYLFIFSSLEGFKEGIHVGISGKSGRGKSSAVSAMLAQFPKKYVITGKISNQSLFYANQDSSKELMVNSKESTSNSGDNNIDVNDAVVSDNAPKSAENDECELKLIRGTIIYCDERGFSEDLEALFKLCITNWNEGNDSTTLDKNNKFIQLRTPPKIAWVISKVEILGNDEVMNRLCHFQVQDNEETRLKINEKIRDEFRVSHYHNSKNNSEDQLVCQAMWEILKSNPICVDIPFIDDIKERRQIEPRELRKILNIISANTTINRYQRPLVGYNQDEIPMIEAVIDDYNYVRPYIAELFKHKDHSIHLTHHEENLLKALRDLKPDAGYFTIRQVVEYTKNTEKPMNESNIRRCLVRRTYIKNHVPLTEKCSFIRRIAGDEKSYLEQKKGRQTWYHVDLEELVDFLSSDDPMELKIGNYDENHLIHNISITLPSDGMKESD